MANNNIEETEDYEFKKSFLYKYMVCSFQYVDPCLKNGKSKLKLILFQLGRVVAVLLIWFVIGFGFSKVPGSAFSEGVVHFLKYVLFEIVSFSS